MTKSKFNLVVIKHSEENKFFISKIPCFIKSKGLSLLYSYLEFKGKDGVVYKKLNAFVEEKGKKDYVIKRFEQEFTKDEAEKEVYKYQMYFTNKFGEDCILNDLVVSPEKYQCTCGYMVRVHYKQQHDEKYCKVKQIDALIEELEIV